MEAIFLELVKLSLIGSLFAAAVMLVRLIFPKTPKWIFCLLWGVVALRLICPVSIESSFSLVPDRIASGQIITSVADEYIGDVNIIYESNAEYSNAVEAGRQPIYSDDGYYVVTEKDSLEAPKTVGETLYPILSRIWVAGMVLMLVYTVVSYLMLRRKMAEATRLRDNIWQCEQVDSPFVLGFFKPKIYLPYTITEADMVNVIAHEKAHIHRKDHWWKPMGFILLSIHWFNPVLWLAYILLCRDIEAACDEKVIKHMERDEMRAYSIALLNCSVNRRRIAACPLAFGEVGVKERVKTVMNYKKPAFWLVIAAVALCIVVAVSFLTNPKDYGPTVGNPQMLELPGVEWFATPDELKEALNITEEQIVEEFTTSGYILEMWVTDLTLYGRDVPFAKFSFCFNDSDDTALRRAVVFFSEDTDMNKLEKELVEIYGPGKSEPYSYSLYDNNADRNGRFGRRVPSLEAAAENEIYQNVVEGNPFRDALEDPEYMTHHWVTENGLSIIPEEVVEYFRSAEDEDMPQDDDMFMQKLDQMPWVVISMSNRHPAAIVNEVKGTESEWDHLYTKNCMAFSADLLAEYSHTAQAVKPRLLEFKGTRWGATVEEVKEALGVQTEHIVSDSYHSELDKAYSEHQLIVTGGRYFGSVVETAEFHFIEYEGHAPALYEIRFNYRDNADMAAIRANLIQVYGPGTNYGFTDYVIHEGEAQSFINYNRSSSVEYGTTIEPNATVDLSVKDVYYRWISTAKGSEIMPEEIVEGLIAAFGDGEGMYADREAVLKWIDNHVWVTLTCADDTGWSQKTVRFAAEYIPLIQQFSK